MKAKTASLLSKVVAGVMCITCHILLWLGMLPKATSPEIISCSITVMAVFGGVDINLITEKITGWKNISHDTN